MRAAEARRDIRVEGERRGQMEVRLRPVEHRPHRVGQAPVGDVHTTWHDRVAALTRYADHGRIDAEHLDDRPVTACSVVSRERLLVNVFEIS